MGVYFNVNGKLSLNDIIDCRCSIIKKQLIDGTLFTKTETKRVSSIWGSKNSEAVKLWERKTETLPQFLILGKTIAIYKVINDYQYLPFLRNYV